MPTGGLFGILSLFAFAIILPMLWNAWKASRSGSETQTPTGIVYSDKNIPIYKIARFWIAVAVFGLWIWAMLAVRSDYREYDPKKDGVPREAPVDGREAAEDMLKK